MVEPVSTSMMLAAGAQGLGALLQGGAAVGGLFGGGTQRAQNEIALRNLMLQERLARLQEEMATAGTVDARGNRVQYVPGVGWVTTPTDATRTILNRQDQETAERLAGDAQRARAGRISNALRRGQESGEAGARFAGLGRGRITPEQQEGLLLERSAAAVGADREARSRAIGEALLRRGGSSNALDLSGTGTSLAAALASARAETPTAFATNEGARRNALDAGYNLFATRASNIDDVPFAPSTPDSAVDRAAYISRAVAPQGLGAGMGVRVPTLQEDRFPVRLGSVGSAVQGGGEWLEAMLRRLNQGTTNPNPSGRNGGIGWYTGMRGEFM